jgi:Plasmid encoded RepA protein
VRRDSGKSSNYRSEEKIAQAKMQERMLSHRQNRNAGEHGKIVQMSTTLVLAGLPYRPTDEVEIVRSARTARGFERTTFYALGKNADGSRVPMPFGSDRTLIHWAIDMAIKRNHPFVPLSAARTFLDSMGFSVGGKSYILLRESLNRISGLAIVVERPDDDDRRVMVVISHALLPRHEKIETINSRPPGILFGADFFAEITKRHVPFLWPVLKTLHKKPQMQDFVLFLHRRCSDANSESFIPWEMLREQLWQADTNPWRLRIRMAVAIDLFKIAWPELNAVATTEGLKIGPPLKGRHFLPFITEEKK